MRVIFLYFIKFSPRNQGSPSGSYLPEVSKLDSSPNESLLSLSDAKIKVARASLAEYLSATDIIVFSKFCKCLRSILWQGKLSELFKNLIYAKSYTSRPHIIKIAVKFSKMVCPERIQHRGSLTIPIVAKGLKYTFVDSQVQHSHRYKLLPDNYFSLLEKKSIEFEFQ